MTDNPLFNINTTGDLPTNFVVKIDGYTFKQNRIGREILRYFIFNLHVTYYERVTVYNDDF